MMGTLAGPLGNEELNKWCLHESGLNSFRFCCGPAGCDHRRLNYICLHESGLSYNHSGNNLFM